MLGPVAGKRVVELGAGIGRFTGALAAAGAASVLAVDFMEHLIAENRRVNGHWCGAHIAKERSHARKRHVTCILLHKAKDGCPGCCIACGIWGG